MGVAIITGGGTGLGFSIAKRLGRDGHSVVLTSRNRAHLDPAVDRLATTGVKALAIPTDVRDPEQVERMVSETARSLGRIDVLI